MRNKTKAIHFPYQKEDPYGALSMPVYNAVAYEFADAAVMADAFCGRIDLPDYSRVTNPTVTYFERKIANLTEASEVIAFNSGMAAISNTFLCIASAGKNIVSSTHMFGNTFALMSNTLSRFNVGLKLCNLIRLEDVENTVNANTCCIFLEIVTNPQMEVADLRGLSEIAHKHGIPLIADTTAIPFTEFSAKELGVDIEIVSSTKYFSGGGTALGGLVIDYGTTKGFGKRMRSELLLNLGAYMTPHAAYMQTLGLENLSARYSVQAANALYLAKKLKTLPGINNVTYPGLEDNPFHEISRMQFGPTAGAMLTIDLRDKDACFKFINNLKLVCRATNLFDNRTLAIHPASTIFGPFTDAERAEMDILDTTIRLSVGLEDMDDIFEDIKQALEQ